MAQPVSEDLLELLVQRTILAEIKISCFAANLPMSFIEAIKMEKVGPYEWTIRNTLRGKNGEPLAKWLEFGTRDHWVQGNPVLRWIHKGPGRSARPAIYHQRSDTKEGDVLFSTGHYVKGLPRLEAMTNGFEIGKKRAQRELEAQYGI